MEPCQGLKSILLYLAGCIPQSNINLFYIFSVIKLYGFNDLKIFARVVWWRYWKQLQTPCKALGHLRLKGFIIS
ncbi:hypothetical protein E27107_200322 [Elizabethkingia anophelis]|nr:hypothetical protein E18064_360326 [Elizabethkingia anophelis]CDN77669.1 hypothetical protein E27107_200322 [Elizabethkingia anophelis]